MTNTQTSLIKTERQKSLVKIRHLDNFAELRANLIAISYLLGVKEAPPERVITEMIGIIKDKFDFFTVQDITDAIKEGLAGKLTLNGKILNLETYNNFSIPYVCKFFIAYREYLDNNNRLLPKLIESPEMTDKDKKLTHSKWLHSLIFPQIEKLNKGEIDEVQDYGNTLYNYLDKKFINYTRERKDGIKEMAVEELLREKRMERAVKPENRTERGLSISEKNEIGKEITDIIMGGKDSKGLVRTRSKCIALRIFLNECKEMDRDIISEIKEYEGL